MEERKKYLTASLILTALEKQSKLENIKSLTRAQAEVAKNPDTDSLLAEMVRLINEKQQIIDKINLLDKNFQKVYSELDNLIGLGQWQNNAQHPDSEIRELHSILKSNNILLQGIQQIDIQNTNKMREHSQGIQLKLKQLRQGKKVAYSYEGGHKPVDAWFVDKKR